MIKLLLAVDDAGVRWRAQREFLMKRWLVGKSQMTQSGTVQKWKEGGREEENAHTSAFPSKAFALDTTHSHASVLTQRWRQNFTTDKLSGSEDS